MSLTFPYSYISCPCTDISCSEGVQDGEGDEDERTFDPRSPRANYSLYPPEHLFYCEDCHEIRCPRCTLEEIVCWYCPSCLFEVPSSMVKSEGNRCTRNCFNCPICTAPLSVSALESETGGTQGPWILTCGYCNWTSLDIGIRFEKPNNIYGQLAKIKSGSTSQKSVGSSDAPPTTDPDARFTSLKTFYTSQLSSSNPSNPLLSSPGDYSYSSPSSLARIMSLYTSLNGTKKASTKPLPMREALSVSEGLHIHDPLAETSSIEKLRTQGWESTTSPSQRGDQFHAPRFVDDVWPIPALLRTKRSKRCRICRHILVKPEAKVLSTRFRIRLVAVNYIPHISLKPLQSSSPTLPSTTNPSSNTATIDPTKALPPLRPLQFILTLKNPMFDPVKITLATPSRTPGKWGSKVTILCPQFEIGASADVWDEALSGAQNKDGSSSRDKTTTAKKGEEGTEGKQKEAEAGKVWERGRNWTSVVLEVVCAEIKAENGDGQLAEDEDVLEIPVFVRVEYEAEVGGDEGGVGKEGTERRELAYWCVLGVGRIARLGD